MSRVVKILLGIFLGSFVVTFAGLMIFYPAVRQPLALPARDPSPLSARILFVGDIMLDRSIRTVLTNKGPEHVFGGVAPLLRSVDFVAGNLEGPITDEPSHSSGTDPGDLENTRFTFAPAVAKLLAAYGFSLVSIGNNHISDFGREGIESTEHYLSEARIGVVGNPYASSADPAIEEVNGIRVAFTAYDEFIRPDAAKTVEAIRRGSSADFVVVMAHWGDEYDPEPPERSRVLAGQFASAGADLIIGTHSHVVGRIEDIGSTRVYYSLGNFIFDQYWDPSVRCGLGVTLILAKRGGATTALYETTQIGLQKGGATVLGCS